MTSLVIPKNFFIFQISHQFDANSCSNCEFRSSTTEKFFDYQTRQPKFQDTSQLVIFIHFSRWKPNVEY